MDSFDKFPATGVYRQHQKEINSEAERLFEDFKHNFDSNVRCMFGIETAMLEPEEVEDLNLFAEYAIRRLAIHALNAPAHKKLLEERGVDAVVSKGVFDGDELGVGHDVMHAVVAFARSNGASLNPAFNIPENEGAKWNDAVAAGEEMMVYLFRVEGGTSALGNRGESMMEFCLRGGDPIDWIKKYWKISADRRFDPWPEVFALKDTDPVAYFSYIQEAEWTSGFMGGETPRDFMRTSKDPAYHQLMANLYVNYQQENPNPKIGFREFQRILKPLLERLRNKDSNPSSDSELVEH